MVSVYFKDAISKAEQRWGEEWDKDGLAKLLLSEYHRVGYIMDTPGFSKGILLN